MSMDKNFLGMKFSNSSVDLVGDEEPVHGSKDSDGNGSFLLIQVYSILGVLCFSLIS